MALALERYASEHQRNQGLIHHILKERSRKEREMSIPMTTIENPLSEDVIIEILSWLPVKALLQFKYVCKSWYEIISSPDFISKHLENYYNNTGSSDCLLAQFHITQAGELELFEFLVDDETSTVLSHASLRGGPIYNSYIYGPCNGIYFLDHYYCYGPDRALWNPATNQLKTLPPLINKPNLPSNIYYAGYDTYGFGFDPVNKDYKVVILKAFWSETDEGSGDRYPLSVLVYSSIVDSWRYWGDLEHHYDLQDNKCYICLNGDFYWLGSYEYSDDQDQKVIISFNITTDSFREIQVPDCGVPTIFDQSLGVHQNTLALFTVQNMELLDIWALSEGCWTKKFTIGPIVGLCRPVGHWKDKVIFESWQDFGYKLSVCDPNTQEISDVGHNLGHKCTGIFVYRESLVSFKDGIGCEELEENKTQAGGDGYPLCPDLNTIDFFDFNLFD